MRVLLTLSLALGTVAGGCEFGPDPVVLTEPPEAGAPRGGGAVFASEDPGTPFSHHGARTSPPDGTADGTMEDPPAPDALPSADASSPESPLVCCGDGVCVAGEEDCVGCPSDCGDCSLCGDGACGVGESVASCQTDCAASLPPHCGNGACGGNESCALCAADCGPCPGCGDGVCSAGETCARDCGGSSCP